MKLLELKMNNFRQYIGQQKIEFAKDENNITIIFGENGKGKTGIYRALMFCLYGSTHIQQDNPKEPIHLVNMKLLEQSSRAVDASVEIMFEHNGEKYTMFRSIKGIKRGNRIEERFDRVKLSKIDSNGNFGMGLLDQEIPVKQKMNEILDEDIKDFFLFDAEKIDTLAKTDSTVKREVKKAIFKLLQIESVDEAKIILDTLYTSEKKSIISNSNNINITKKEEEIDEAKAKLTSIKIHLEKLIEERGNNNKLIQGYELQLQQNEDIRIIQEQILALKNNLSSKVSHFEDLKQQVVEILKNDAAYLMFNSSFSNVKNYLNSLRHDEKNIVPADVLENSINNKVCLCCNNDLNKHIENLEYVIALKENYKRSELSYLASSITNMIIDKENQYSMKENQILSMLIKLNELIRERKQIQSDINSFNKEIGSKAGTELNLEKIARALKDEKERLIKTQSEIVSKENEKNEVEKAIDKLESELQNMIKESKTLEFDSKVLARIDSLRNDIKEISEEYSTSMRKKLTDFTTSIFKKLIDKKDVDLISKIDINEKFELVIIGGEGFEITQDISQGQRQIVALSFITALAQVAAGDSKTINFPLFMDSPFNRISGVNRDQLITNIPLLTSQWILLLTDTELTVNEEKIFKETKKLGKFYRIDQIEPMNAQLCELNINEILTTRGI